jgi:hypothetical protein
MTRMPVVSILCLALLASSIPAAAQEKAATNLVAPSAAVAAAWAREDASSKAGKTVRALYFSYAALQAADVASTLAARRRGAVEVNPLMNVPLPQALATKSLMTVSSLVAAKTIGKRNKKAAIVIMVALNSMTAMVVANNVRNVRRLEHISGPTQR